MSFIFIILSEAFISYSTFIHFCGDFFPYEAMLNFHSMQIYVDMYGAFIILHPTGSLLIVRLSAPSLFFHISIHLLLVFFPSSLQHVYAFREESSGKVMEGKSL